MSSNEPISFRNVHTKNAFDVVKLLFVIGFLKFKFKDRRRFLIVSIFDFCFITLLWLICTVTKGNDWSTVFKKEINIFEPNFLKVSLFDIVIVAVCRMTIVLFFYAVLLIKHWVPVGVTTGVTTLFLVIKVLFFFSPAQGTLPQYLVILSSFIIAWFELWLMPFRVLPRERRNLTSQENSLTVATVRNVLTDEEFRSAMEFSSGSESDMENAPKVPLEGRLFSKEQYIAAVNNAEIAVKRLYEQVGTWKIVSRDPEIRFCEQNRLYFLRTEINCSAESLFRAVWKDNKLWNQQILETKILLHIDPSIEVIHCISAPAMRGYISSRDFLDVRKNHVDTSNSIYEGYYVSVDSAILPPNPNGKIIRGYNGPNLIRVSKSLTSSKMCIFEWLIDNDVKPSLFSLFQGGVPKRIIERTMCSFLVAYIKNLQNFIQDCSSEYP
ncbi:unnamed protein product [Dracunculus medinensis]|uniref:START domain-containing protein n=1 Tax=Dracunculus medinensis TaxID=318479 RepID=A0A158Q2S0_DRAME|nr:unnamed protein product [Dracunculus medinensis]